MTSKNRALRCDASAPAPHPGSRSNPEGTPGHRSGEGSENLWEHIREDSRHKPDPPPTQEQEQQ